ncbi:MAG: hypothetical protein ACYDA0_06480 [Candidatus Dormibacteraceae bacterium]
MNRRARRPGRGLPPGVRYQERKPHLSREARHLQARGWARSWRVPIISAAALVFVLLVGIRLGLQGQPPQPDENALRSDIASGRTGTEVTFVAAVIAPPASVGDHERIDVKDSLGDQLELDYNTQLGQWIPTQVGDQLTVHGQLYLDPGRVGVHCLHAQTSTGCPLPGWIQFEGRTYS